MNIKLLNKIWNGIKSGKYKHEQSTWHCGSHHCIAGWVVVLNHRDCYDKDYVVIRQHPIKVAIDVSVYASECLSLQGEEDILFYSQMSDSNIQHMVDKFQAGYRYNGEYSRTAIYEESNWTWGGQWLIHDGHLHVKVARKCNPATMMKKVKDIWQGKILDEPYMSETIFTDKFERCITVEVVCK